MPRRAFDRLRKMPQGRALLINICECVNDQLDAKTKAAELNRLRDFFQLLSKEPASSDTLGAAYRTVWDNGHKFQCRGARLQGDKHHVVVFRTVSHITQLVLSQEHNDERIAALKEFCDPVVASSHYGFSSYQDFNDEHGRDLAEALNEMSDDVPFFLSLVSDNRRDRRPIWYTRRTDCAQIHKCTDDCIRTNNAPGNVLDWLGFGDNYSDMPIFAFCARTEVALGLTRPSALDAIDKHWFKYRLYRSYADDWGRALHIAKYNAGDHSDLDGAPEAIGPSLKIPGLFECKYLGKAAANSKAWSEAVVGALARPRTPDEMIDQLCDTLWPNLASRTSNSKN